VYSSIIAAGESSGQLNVMLNRLAMLTSKQLHLRRSISGAMIYPALLMNVGVIVMTVLLVFVLPRFAGMFKSLDAPLPPTTRFMMFLSDVVRGYWWAVLAVIGACGFGVWQYVHSAAGRRTIGNTLLTLPRFGKIAKELIAARIVRLLGVLLDSNVPVLDALALTRDAAGNEKFAQLVADAEDAVSRGDNISSAFDHSNLINPSICEAIRNGERSGQIGPLLLNIADFMDEENEVVVRSLSSLIEPLILIVLGVFVGFVAISMFMPLFDLTAMGGGP
jgi:type II secretory pathway component PulF